MNIKTLLAISLTLTIFSFCHIQGAIAINKVVIPAAGLGTRLLPFTKTVPKEMIPLGTKPAIQLIIEEAMASNIHSIITIISRHKSALEHFFDPSKATALNESNKDYFLADFHTVFSSLKFSYIYQDNPLGLGHAVMLAQQAVGNEYFGVMLPDDIFFSTIPAFKQLYTIAEQEQATVIALQEVPQESVSRYGIVKIKKDLGNGLYELDDLVEKPAMNEAPSRMAIAGRYILSPKIFDSLNELYGKHTQGEFHLTNAIADMLKKGERVLGFILDSERHDIGIPVGWTKGVIAYALHQEGSRQEILEYLQAKIAQYKK